MFKHDKKLKPILFEIDSPTKREIAEEKEIQEKCIKDSKGVARSKVMTTINRWDKEEQMK